MNRRFDGLGAAGSVGVLLALIALWWAASHGGWVSRVFLPSPEATLESLLAGLGAGGELLAFTGATVGRMLLGWGLASVLGVALGALIGSSAAARVWIAPTLEAIRPLPASAVMPLAMAIFGLSGSMVLAVGGFGALWAVLLATGHGPAPVHPQLRGGGPAAQQGRFAAWFSRRIAGRAAVRPVLAVLCRARSLQG